MVRQPRAIQLQDYVAMSLFVVTFILAIALGIQLFKHFQAQDVTVLNLPTLPKLLIQQSDVEGQLSQVRYSIGDVKKDLADLRRQIDSERQGLLDPGPPPQRPPFWTLPSGELRDLIPWEYQYGAYLVRLQTWKLKKEVFEAANARIAALENTLNQKAQSLSDLIKQEVAATSDLTALRNTIATKQYGEQTTNWLTYVWNEWISPILHLGLNWALIATAINLGVRFLLLRRWLGVGQI